MIDLISEEKHKTLYKEWKGSFEHLAQGLMDEGKKVTFVAMSRKMPRLIERVNQQFTYGELKNFHFVSEQVLPYTLSHFDAERQRIVIADDAMYYGSTINRISGYIRALTSVKPYVLPVAISKVVGALDHAEVQRTEENTIRVQDIPFLTTQNAEWILRLNRPIDVEFPILHFDIASAPAKEGVRMEKVLEENFPNNEIYTIEHHVLDARKPVRNYNVLPEQGSTFDRWNKDFCKMRFFVSDQSIQVAVYAPGILPETVLNDSQPLFSDERIQHLWEDIKSYQVKSWPESLPGEFEKEVLVNRFQSAYATQCVRSKIIWANYLASYLYLLEQKDAIIRTITSMYGEEVAKQGNFDIEDMRLLLPSDKVVSLTASLNRYYNEGSKTGSVFYGLHSSVLANQELVPEEYFNDYTQTVRRGLQRCRTADEALSVVFSSQHFFINDGRLTNDTLQRTQRLGFGITYTTLENKLSFPVGIGGLWKSIHKWIDKNIDEGTVKPKYERVVVDGNAYWLRMFRAGENEDSYTKLRRLCEFIISKARQKENRGYVERDVVDDLLTLAWEDPCGIVRYKYKWGSFETTKDELTYRITIGDRSFLDYLIELGYLQSIVDSSGISRVSTMDDSQAVTPLSFNQEQAVSDYIDAYYYYAKTRNLPYIMNNFFLKHDKKTFEENQESLADLCCRFAVFMKKAIPLDAEQETLSKEFLAFNKSLSHIIHNTIKANVFAHDNQENDNRRRIREWLQKDDFAEYGVIKKKLLATAIVQELFNQIFLETRAEKESADTLINYLSIIQEDGEENKVISKFLQMDETERERLVNREEVVRALQGLLPQ